MRFLAVRCLQSSLEVRRRWVEDERVWKLLGRLNGKASELACKIERTRIFSPIALLDKVNREPREREQP